MQPQVGVIAHRLRTASLDFFLILCICACVGASTCECVTYRIQKRMADPLELEI